MSEQNKQSQSRKIAIVTGGSRGIGRNTVVSLAKRHVDSIFTFNTHSEDAEAAYSTRPGRSPRRSWSDDRVTSL